MRKIHLILLSVISGILLSLPWIVPALGWVLLFAFVPLLLADDLCVGQQKAPDFRFSFLLGYFSFLSWNVLSTWWIAYVSLAGMLFIVSLNALLMAGVWWMKNKMHHRFGLVSGYFSMVIFWIAFEHLNHRGMLPWPWLTLGNGLANTVKFVQWYEFTGVLGGSLWILLSNILIFEICKKLSIASSRKIVWLVTAFLFFVGAPIAVSLHLYVNYFEKGEVQHVVVVQPNIDPYTEKFSGMNACEQVNRLVSLAQSKITDSTDFVLFPETALPSLWEDSLVSQKADLSQFWKLVLRFPASDFICGAITQRRLENFETVSKTSQVSVNGNFYFDSYNSAVLINGPGKIQYSHKNILVAGVEKDPSREYFSFLPDMMFDLGGMKGSFAAGKEPDVFRSFSGQIIGPVICFESVFGNHVRQLVEKGAQYIVVLTNDGWWKDASGIWQHWGYSRIRAIETRRSIVRSANTGISGVIDQRGEIINQTAINTSVALSSEICTNDSITFYARYGDYLGWIALIITGLVVAYWNLGDKKESALIRM